MTGVYVFLGSVALVCYIFARLLVGAFTTCLGGSFNLLCFLLGTHPADMSTWESDTQMGMGMFGGPVTTYRWTCRRCGGRCSQ